MSEKTLNNKRIEEEKKTLELMIGMYCRSVHKEKEICSECKGLLDYSFKRIGMCRWKEEKPNCSDCETHCFKPVMKQKIAEVMRYSGPRMIYRHPVIAFKYLLRKRKK